MRVVHVAVVGDVITRVPVPVLDTAANNTNEGAYAIPVHAFVDAAVCELHVIPSELVITI